VTHRDTPASHPRRQLRLLAQNLDDGDTARIVAFLRIGRERLACDWEIVSSGAVHVLLMGTVEPDNVIGIEDSPLATLRLVNLRAGVRGGPGMLTRPLQYEDLIDVLAEVERKVPSEQTAAPALPATPVKDSTMAGLPASAVPVADLVQGARVRLRRWPPAAMLHGSRYHLRLASFLSTRHIELDELARLSNVSLALCEEFVSALAATGLLDIRPPSPEPQTNAIASATPPPRPAPDTGLFGRIRRSLGILWRH